MAARIEHAAKLHVDIGRVFHGIVATRR